MPPPEPTFGPIAPGTSTLAEALLDGIVTRGAKAIFALPGDFVVPLLRELRRLDRLPIHTLAHEPAVGFAADGAARLGGGLGVACVTFGAGALNMVNAIANAWAEKIPLVVISGAPGLSERRGHLIHHQVKTLTTQLEVMRAVTLAQAVLDDPRTAIAELNRVLDLARLHSRPVYLEVPRDLVTAACPIPTAPPHAISPSPSPAMDRADEAAHHTLAALAMAKSPLLLIDVELRRFGLEDKAALLANRFGLPTLTTLSGRGLLAGTGLIDGTWLGKASEPVIAERFARADLILGLGLLHSDSNLVGHDLDPRIDPRVIDASDELVRFSDRELRCSLGRFLDALLKHATWHSRTRVGPLGSRPTPRSAAPPADAPTPNEPTPDRIALALARFVSRHGPFPVVSDIGDCLFAALHLHDVEVLAPAYYATVGYGIPAALGAMAVTGKRPLVLVGDGAFQMTGLELASALQLGLDPIVILFDNQGWDMVRAFDAEHPAHMLPAVRYELLADSLGCRGHLAPDLATFETALLKAHTERGIPHLIRVPLAASSRSAGLTRFVHALSQAKSKGD